MLAGTCRDRHGWPVGQIVHFGHYNFREYVIFENTYLMAGPTSWLVHEKTAAGPSQGAYPERHPSLTLAAQLVRRRKDVVEPVEDDSLLA